MKRISEIILLIALLVLPVVLFFLPADYFDHGTSICLSKVLLNMECLGCGLTRGIQHLIHFDFQEAWHFNKLSYLVFPICAYYWFIWLLGYYRKFFVKK